MKELPCIGPVLGYRYSVLDRFGTVRRYAASQARCLAPCYRPMPLASPIPSMGKRRGKHHLPLHRVNPAPKNASTARPGLPENHSLGAGGPVQFSAEVSDRAGLGRIGPIETRGLKVLLSATLFNNFLSLTFYYGGVLNWLKYLDSADYLDMDRRGSGLLNEARLGIHSSVLLSFAPSSDWSAPKGIYKLGLLINRPRHHKQFNSGPRI